FDARGQYIDELKTNHETRYNKLKGHFKKLESLHEDLISRNKNLKNDHANLILNYSNLKNRNRELEERLKQLSSAQAASAELDSEYQTILNSTSWQITKPLRILSGRLQKFRPTTTK